jgi:hypothetical protein
MPANTSIGDLITSTLELYFDQLTDNVTNNNALARVIQRKGNVKRAIGGREIREGILYGNNNSVQWYENYDTFTPPTTGQEVMDEAQFAWKQLGGFISVSGREEKVNRGEYEKHSFVEARIKQLQAVLQNTFAASLFSDGTASAGKELTGLRAAVADNPVTGTYGGINRATAGNEFWRNKFSAAVATNASNILSRMDDLYLNICRGSDKPDLVVSGYTPFRYYEDNLQSIRRIGNADEADSGYLSYFYKGAEIVPDFNCANTRMYFLDTDVLQLRVINDRLFDKGEMRQVTNADYKVWPVFFMGNLTTSRAAAHGVLLTT